MADRCILGVYAHPDDETTNAGALMAMYASQGVDVHVITATRGEMGGLGTNGQQISREELPAVRERELRAVLKHFGLPNDPVFLDYRDQELKDADFEEAVDKVMAVMVRVKPDVVLTFGPSGLSGHDDHIAINRIAKAAFERYRESASSEPRLLYTAIPLEIVREFDSEELTIEGIEVEPNIVVHSPDHWHLKPQALRLYQSQEDAQQLAEMLETWSKWDREWFHQVDPPLPAGTMQEGLWAD